MVRVAVWCKDSTAVHSNAEERRVWVKRGSTLLYSSTFDAVLPASASPDDMYKGTAAHLVEHAMSGGTGSVVCFGAFDSGKTSAMNAVPSWAASPTGADHGDVDLAPLGIVARTLCEMHAQAKAAGLRLTLAAVQVYFEMVTDLLHPSASPSGKRTAAGSTLAGASEEEVPDAATGVAMLASAQLQRATSCAEPGSAHVLVEIGLSNGGRLLLVECARSDTIGALDELTRANTSLSLTQQLLARRNPVEAGACVLPRIVRQYMHDGAELALLVCVGQGSPQSEATSLRLAQHAKGKPRSKQQDTRHATVEHLQALVEVLRAGAVPSVGELRDALGGGLCDATALEESLSAIVEERVGFDARLHAHASAAPADAAEVSADDAEGEEVESDEEKAMRAALERDRADAEALTAACDGASEPCPAPPAKPAAGVGSPDARLVTYERAVQGAWKDVQRAKAQAAEEEEQFEKSRAHARQVAAEHEEMESTLLDVAADLENLARNYRQHGSPAMAVPLYVSALAIFERTLGAEHPQVASNLINLGNAFCDQQKHIEAVPVYLRALAIDEKALGHEHPEVGMDLSNLGIAYRALGRADIAKSLFERAHKLMLNALGPDDPKTKAIERNHQAISEAVSGAAPA